MCVRGQRSSGNRTECAWSTVRARPQVHTFHLFYNAVFAEESDLSRVELWRPAPIETERAPVSMYRGSQWWVMTVRLSQAEVDPLNGITIGQFSQSKMMRIVLQEFLQKSEREQKQFPMSKAFWRGPTRTKTALPSRTIGRLIRPPRSPGSAGSAHLSRRPPKHTLRRHCTAVRSDPAS